MRDNVICKNYPDTNEYGNKYMPCSGKKGKPPRDKNYGELKIFYYFLHNDVKRERIKIKDLLVKGKNKFKGQFIDGLSGPEILAKCQSIVRKVPDKEEYKSLVDDLPLNCKAFKT